MFAALSSSFHLPIKSQSIRILVSSPSKSALRQFVRHYTPRPRNKTIPFDHVTVVDQDGKRADKPVPLVELLRSIDKSSEFVELVHPLENLDQFDPKTVVALVKIRNKQEAREHEKLLAVKDKAGKVVHKSVTMHWAISTADFERKMSQVKQGLEKGHRIDITLTTTSKSPVTRARRQEIINSIDEALASHGKQNQPISEEHRSTTLYFVPKEKTQNATTH